MSGARLRSDGVCDCAISISSSPVQKKVSRERCTAALASRTCALALNSFSRHESVKQARVPTELLNRQNTHLMVTFLLPTHTGDYSALQLCTLLLENRRLRLAQQTVHIFVTPDRSPSLSIQLIRGTRLLLWLAQHHHTHGPPHLLLPDLHYTHIYNIYMFSI